MKKNIIPYLASFIIGALSGFFGKGCLPAPKDAEAAEAGEAAVVQVKEAVEQAPVSQVQAGEPVVEAAPAPAPVK